MKRRDELRPELSKRMTQPQPNHVEQPCADGLLNHGPVSRAVAHLVCRNLMRVFLGLVWLLSIRRPRRKPAPVRPQRVLVTGQFLSDRWLQAHVKPIALSAACERVFVVSHQPMAAMTNVEYVCPPGWLTRFVGQALGRYLWFVRQAIRLRPDVVAGFHLLCNGLLALLTARLIGARAMYFCVGGWSEVQGGGAHGENRLFGMMGTDDAIVERALVRAVRRFDTVITMGTLARDYLRSKGVQTSIEVLPGGIDPDEFGELNAAREFDLIGVFRLAPVKRVDVFLEAVKQLTRALPHVRAAIVGDGRLREELVGLRDRLGLQANVDFVGHQSDVPAWLNRARVFLLTSDSEGVALSVMEALTAGCPAVVSDVGDLKDAVVDGRNGFLVTRGDVGAFAERLARLLTDSSALARFSTEARQSARTFSVRTAVARWDRMLVGRPSIDGPGGDGGPEAASTNDRESAEPPSQPPRRVVNSRELVGAGGASTKSSGSHG